MAVSSQFFSALVVMYPILTAPALAGSIADIEHVVLFMQGKTFSHHLASLTVTNSNQRTEPSIITLERWQVCVVSPIPMFKSIQIVCQCGSKLLIQPSPMTLLLSYRGTLTIKVETSWMRLNGKSILLPNNIVPHELSNGEVWRSFCLKASIRHPFSHTLPRKIRKHR